MSKVICLGEIVIDWIRDLKDGGANSDEFAFHAAGVPANVAVALKRLGVDSAMIARVGADALAPRVVAELAKEGVDVAAVYTTHGAITRSATVEVLSNGERRGLALDMNDCADRRLTAADVTAAQSLFADADVLYFGSTVLSGADLREAASAALALAKKHKMLVVSDANIWPAMWENDADCRETILTALADIDVLKVNLAELEFLTGSKEPSAARELLARGPAMVLVTMAEKGACAVTAAADVTLPTEQVVVRDVGGAGDAFVASAIADLKSQKRDKAADAAKSIQLLHHADIEAMLLRANAAGALTASRFGALCGMPTRDEITNFIKENRL